MFSLDKNIVDIVVREILFNPNDDKERLAGDRAIAVFKPVFEEHQDGSKTVVRYNYIGGGYRI
jgi:hypothetical protein